MKPKTKAATKTPTLSVSVSDVMSWGPCHAYTEARVRKLFAGRKRMTALDVLALEIPVGDRFWVVLREELIPARILRLFACDCAERALDREESAGRAVDPRSRAAIEVSRRYAVGEATAEELNAAWYAAGDAARATAGTAAGDAARAAAGYAAWAAAWAAARYAAGAAERQWQVRHLRTMLRKGGAK